MRAVFTRVAVGAMLASAKCAFAYQCQTYTSLTTIQPPNLVVQRDLPVGSEIGTAISTELVPAYRCVNTSPTLSWQDFGIKGYGTYAGTFNGRRVYSTNVAGIGYAVAGQYPNCATKIYWVTGRDTENPNNELMCSINGMWSVQPMYAKAFVTFYKTAEVTGTGQVVSLNVGSFILKSNKISWHSPEARINIGSFAVNTVSCTLGNKSIVVDMGTVNARAFNGPGTWPTDKNTRAFSIPVLCQKGVAINFQIDGNAKDPSRGLLNLSADTSAAKGVALQLLYNDQPLPLSSRVKWQTTTADGNYAIPLKARYLQTDASVTPGVANANATFKLTYQ